MEETNSYPMLPAERKQQSSSLSLAISAIDAALEQKAQDVVGLHVGPLTYVADYYVIASGTSDRHVRGIADRIRKDLKALGEEPLSIAGYETGEWVVIDYGDIVAHVFFEATRNFYDLDGLWSKADIIQLPAQLESVAKTLRTGMYNHSS